MTKASSHSIHNEDIEFTFEQIANMSNDHDDLPLDVLLQRFLKAQALRRYLRKWNYPRKPSWSRPKKYQDLVESLPVFYADRFRVTHVTPDGMRCRAVPFRKVHRSSSPFHHSCLQKATRSGRVIDFFKQPFGEFHTFDWKHQCHLEDGRAVVRDEYCHD